MTEKKGTPTPPTKPDGIITTQRNGQTIVAELFFNPNGTETFSDKLLKTILADSLRFSASDGQEPEKTEILKSNGSMTVSKRGNIERRKRRRLPPHCPHHKTE